MPIPILSTCILVVFITVVSRIAIITFGAVNIAIVSVTINSGMISVGSIFMRPVMRLRASVGSRRKPSFAFSSNPHLLVLTLRLIGDSQLDEAQVSQVVNCLV